MEFFTLVVVETTNMLADLFSSMQSAKMMLVDSFLFGALALVLKG